jgi:hypothetical protein
MSVTVSARHARVKAGSAWMPGPCMDWMHGAGIMDADHGFRPGLEYVVLDRQDHVGSDAAWLATGGGPSASVARVWIS